jgi:low affinity Fe/Cu permease
MPLVGTCSRLLEVFSRQATAASGSATAFLLAVLVIVAWLATGPLFHYSDTWQLVINTGTTIVTFLMVFLIQRAQNKDAVAIQLKLNELIAATAGASNHLISVEQRPERELQILRDHYARLLEVITREQDIGCTHSVEEADERWRGKKDEAGAPSA